MKPATIYIAVTVLLSALFIISLACFFGFYFGLVYPEVQDSEDYSKTTCTITDVTIRPYRCCDVVDCSCSECFNFPLCGLLQANLTEGACCGGPACCRECCSTCTDCSSHSSTSSGGSSGTTCYTYECNCYCCQSVQRETCRTACGTCNEFTVEGEFEAKGQLYEFERVEICGRDDVGCVDGKQGFYEGEVDCWYQESNPNEGLVFSDPVYLPDGHWALVGLAAAGMGCSFLGCLLLGAVALVFAVKARLRG
ncbi:hypothetical protein QOT17_019586 [Balamuthia mandrillaris]